MGAGRRMKKQGPPAPLDEFRIPSSKKSRLGGNENVRGKKRNASGQIKASVPAHETLNGATISGLRQKLRDSVINRKTMQPSSIKKIRSKPTTSLRSDEFMEDRQDSNEKRNVATDVLGGDDDIDKDLLIDSDNNEEANTNLEDEFLESGSSVYNSDPQDGKGRFSDDDESNAEEQLTAANIEGMSRRLDKAQEGDAKRAQLELEEAALQTNIDGDRPQVLDGGSEAEDPLLQLAPDLQLLRSRMTDTIRVLDDFAKLAEPGRPRSEYTSQLLKDISLYYGYSAYLAEKLFKLFTPREAFAFFEANETARPVTIRTNTLKTHRRELAQALINRGVTLEPVGKWSKVGLQIFESQVPLGATPEYLAGHYILQAASSFLPVMALAPQEQERILDMAAAPGGKTTYIAALMRNTGSIFANDSNKSRAKGLVGNIHRLGTKNTIVCNYDAQEFPKVIGGFDRVLLDAPCSGTGVIAKDPSVKTNKTEKDFMQLPHMQKLLLLAAIDSVDHASKTGGYLVYSTCSVTVEENEQVVQYALSKRPNVKLVETGLTFGVDGFVSYQGKKFDPRMKMTKRYYPHKYNVDGFFVSKLQKVGPNLRTKAANGATTTNGHVEQNDIIVEEDKTPVTGHGGTSDGSDGFGGWDEDGDRIYIERARRRLLKKKGIDPKAKRRQNFAHGAGENM